MQPRNGKLSNVRVTGDFFDSTEVALESEKQATDLLQALGIDPWRSVVRFRVQEGLVANKRAQGIISALLVFSIWQWVNFLPHALQLPAYIALALLIFLNWWPSTVAVGPDGVLVTSPSRLRRNFHPFHEIAEANVTSWGVELRMKSGRTIELRTEASPKTQSETRDALVTRIRAGLLAVDPTSTADVASLVARAGRPIDEWLHALEAVAAPATGYRVATVPAEKLWRVVEDPKADPSARAGAAAALRVSLDDEGRARLAAVAANSVHPKVRVALDALASDEAVDDEHLRELLEGCEEQRLRA